MVLSICIEKTLYELIALLRMLKQFTNERFQ